MSSTDIRRGKGFGYKDTATGKICQIRCFKCGKENYAAAVATGSCAWCGYDANVKATRTVVQKTGKGALPTRRGAVKLLILEDRLRADARKRRAR